MVDTHFLITAECMVVTSAMRKSSRWVNAGIASILGAPTDAAAVSAPAGSSSLSTASSSPDLRSADLAENIISPSSVTVETEESGENGDQADYPPTPTESEQSHSNLSTDSKSDVASAAVLALSTSSPKADDSIAANAPETQLIMGFSTIRAIIAGKNVSDVSVRVLAKPFLEVIKSPLVSGHITSLALTSLEKFLTLGVLNPGSVDAAPSVNEVAHALTHCRFEATDRQEDDAVLLQLMALLEKLVLSPFGQILSGKAIQEIVETCLSMAKQMKRRDTLRRSVVGVLMSLSRSLFSSSREDTDENQLQSNRTMVMRILVDVLDPNRHNYNNNIRSTVMSVLTLCFECNGGSTLHMNTSSVNTSAVNTSSLDAGKDNRADQDRIEDVIRRLWMALARIIRVTHSPKLVQDAMLLIGTIMNTNPEPYKAQFEFVLVYLLTSLTPLSDLPRDDNTDDMFYAGVPNRAKCVKSAPIEPGSSTLSIPTAALQRTPESREVMVEALVSLAVASPTLFSDLFVTYDCDKASPDLCEDLMGFLCRNAYPDSASWSTPSVPPLCLEAVLSALNSWTELMLSGKLVSASEDTRLKERLSARKGKALESRVAETFNNSPSKGIAAMYADGLVKKNDPKDLARFFHHCQRINKAVLGKYFSRSENKDVLEHYVNAFDFSDKRIDEALRILLRSFRLPGESAQIENLLQKFADHYIASGDKVEKTSDSAFILAYAVLMLNTDHYSPTVKRRMDYDAFKKNVQGVNKDIPDDYVQAIFDGITSQEIIMPEEHDTDETFDYTWRETVQSKEKDSEPFETNVYQQEVIKDIFETNWRPIVSTLSFVFATATDDLVFRRVISGFHQLAFLASRFHAHQALTHIIASLSQISALTSGDLAFPNSNIEIRIENHISVMVSDLSTQIGDDLKAQMASITLFRILNVAAAETSRNAYALVSKALTNLHLYGLGTPTIIPRMHPLPPFHTFERSKTGKPVGIFSALSSYLTSSSDTPAEPSDESVDAALGATDCIKVCGIDSTIENIVRSAPEQLALGALDVIPNQSDEKYLPAKEFLLQLAGFASEKLPELRSKVSETALNAGLIATALETVPTDDAARGILDKLQSVDDENTLSAILSRNPTPSVWRALSLVKTCNKTICEYVQQHANDINDDSLEPILKMLGTCDDEMAAVQALYAISQHLRKTSTKNSPKTSYIQSLSALASHSGNKNGDVRELALSDLQNELLHEKQPLTWAEAANDILIPKVIQVLLKPDVWKRDPQGMDLTRQQAASILGKAFLHLTVSLKAEENKADTDAWIEVLRGLDRLLSSRRQPALKEGVVEMLKNVILVSHLASKGSPEFWNLFQNELEGFLPEVAKLATQKDATTDVNNDDKDEKDDKDGKDEKDDKDNKDESSVSTEQSKADEKPNGDAKTESS